MHPAYYHMAHACVMCFDVTRKQTYKNLPTWYKELREYRAGIPVVCIANKIDVDSKVICPSLPPLFTPRPTLPSSIASASALTAFHSPQ